MFEGAPGADFRRLLLAGGLSSLGSAVATVALPLLVAQSRYGIIGAGVVASLRVLGSAIAPLIGGIIADHVDRRRLIVMADVLRALLVALSIAALPHADNTFGFLTLAISTTGEGLVGTALGPAVSAMLRSVVPANETQKALSTWQSCIMTTTLAGPALGGLLVAVAPVSALALNLTSYLMSAVLVLRITTTTPGRPHDGLHLLQPVRHLFKNAYLRAYAVAMGIVNFASSGLLFTALMLFAQRGSMGSLSGGVVLSLAMSGAVLGAVVAKQNTSEHDLRQLLFLAGAYSVCVAVMVIEPAPVVWASALFLTGIASTWVTVRLNARILSATPQDHIGRTQGAIGLVAGSLYPLAQLMTGLSIKGLGQTRTLLIFLCLFLLIPVLQIFGPLRLPSGNNAVRALERDGTL